MKLNGFVLFFLVVVVVKVLQRYISVKYQSFKDSLATVSYL